jgi:transposase
VRQPDGDPIPQKAKARIERLLDRLDLVLKLIEQVESARDAVLKKDTPADEAERMIRSLTDLRSIGPDFATLLVREAFVRQSADSRLQTVLAREAFDLLVIDEHALLSQGRPNRRQP